VTRRAVAAFALFGVASGCTTFSDAGVIARVDDEKLTVDEFEELLGGTAASGEEARSVIDTWITSSLPSDLDSIDPPKIVGLYGDGIEAATFACPYLIVTDGINAANDAADDLRGGTPASDVFEEFNVDPGIPADQSGQCIGIELIDPSSGLPEIDALLSVTADDPIAVATVTAVDGTELGLVVMHVGFADLSEFDRAAVTASVGPVVLADSADIWVDARYGTFDPRLGVIPLGG